MKSDKEIIARKIKQYCFYAEIDAGPVLAAFWKEVRKAELINTMVMFIPDCFAVDGWDETTAALMKCYEKEAINKYYGEN